MWKGEGKLKARGDWSPSIGGRVALIAAQIPYKWKGGEGEEENVSTGAQRWDKEVIIISLNLFFNEIWVGAWRQREQLWEGYFVEWESPYVREK